LRAKAERLVKIIGWFLEINVLDEVALADPKRLPAIGAFVAPRRVPRRPARSLPRRFMNERRNVARTRILRNAEIILNDRGTLLHCTLLDLNQGGARLSLGSTYRISEAFELTFDNARTRRKCRVMWRTETQLGITFEQPR
jgi:hypothetical protein